MHSQFGYRWFSLCGATSVDVVVKPTCQSAECQTSVISDRCCQLALRRKWPTFVATVVIVISNQISDHFKVKVPFHANFYNILLLYFVSILSPLHFGTLQTGFYYIHAYPDNVYIIIWGGVTYHLHGMNYLFASMCILCSPKTCINLDWDETEVCFGIQRLCSQLIDVHLQMWTTEIPPVPPVCKALPVHNENGKCSVMRSCDISLKKKKEKKKSVFLIMFYSWLKMKLFKWWCYRIALVWKFSGIVKYIYKV